MQLPFTKGKTRRISPRRVLIPSIYLDFDEDPGPLFIMVPIASMTIMLDEVVMLVMFIEPALIIVIVMGQRTGGAGSNKSSHEGGEE